MANSIGNFLTRAFSQKTKGKLGYLLKHHLQPKAIYLPTSTTASGFLIDALADAMKIAWREELNCCREGLPDSKYLNIFPGEHYRLLSGFIKALEAQHVVEIGTWTGMGCLAMRNGLPPGGKITTFDVIAWDKLGVPSHFSEDDLKDGRIVQELGDLASDAVFEKHRATLEEADMIFMDAPKDGIFEYKMLAQLAKLSPKPNKLLILDDIRLPVMYDFWRSIQSPKLDISAFGHRSGTGLVDISEPIRSVRG